MVIARERGLERAIALTLATVTLGIAVFFVVMARRGAINPEAWLCAMALVPIGLLALVLATRDEHFEIAPREVRCVRRTLGRTSVVVLGPITTVRIDALGTDARVAVVDEAGVVHALYRARVGDDRAARIADQLGVPIVRR